MFLEAFVKIQTYSRIDVQNKRYRIIKKSYVNSQQKTRIFFLNHIVILWTFL